MYYSIQTIRFYLNKYCNITTQEFNDLDYKDRVSLQEQVEREIVYMSKEEKQHFNWRLARGH